MSKRDEVVFVEPNAARVSLRTAAILLAFTVVFTGLMAGTYLATQPRLQASAAAQKLRLVSEVLPKTLYDNNLLKDAITLPPQPVLFLEGDTTLYRASKVGKPVAIVMEAAATDGYSGRIQLLLAVGQDDRVLAVRVTQHKETPGLGDYIDPKKDRNKQHPWISQFEGQSLARITPEKWRVRKDGGVFDQMAGATISARAVTNATRRALEWLAPRRAALLALPAGGRFETDAPVPTTEENPR